MQPKIYPDMTMETNHWKINNPKWNDKNAPKWKCTDESYWTGIFGSNYFLQIKKGEYGRFERIMFDYYCKEEHYYYLWWYAAHDLIFASYDLDEVIRFVKKLSTTKMWMRDLYVQDVVTKQYYAFVTENESYNWFLSLFKGCKAISLKRLLNKLGAEQLRRLFIIRECDIKGQTSFTQKDRLDKVKEMREILDWIIEQEECFQLKDLAINGKDLLAIGIPEGKEIGRILNMCLAYVIDGTVDNTKENLMEIVQTTTIPSVSQ